MSSRTRLAVHRPLAYPSAWGPRPAIWRDSLQLIASRPILGYGPDNFGLVYPRFQASFLGSQQVDKAHSEALQVWATQGLLGLVAYLWLLAAFVRAFVKARRKDGAVAILAGWVAYQVTLLLNFSALAAAFPFWIFAAAAIESAAPCKIGESHRQGAKNRGAYDGSGRQRR